MLMTGMLPKFSLRKLLGGFLMNKMIIIINLAVIFATGVVD